MQKQTLRSFIGLSIIAFVGFTNSSHATASARTSLSLKSPISRTLEYLKTTRITSFTKPIWTNVRALLSRSSTHFYSHRYAYGIGLGSLIIGSGIVWGIRKIYSLQSELEKRNAEFDQQTNRHTERISNIQIESAKKYNELLIAEKLAIKKYELLQQLYQETLRKNLNNKITVEIKAKEPQNNLNKHEEKPEEEIREKIEVKNEVEEFEVEEELLPPPPPSFEEFQNSIKEINENIKEIEDNTTGIKEDLQEAFDLTKDGSKDEVEQAIRAVFQKYPLIKNTAPKFLIDWAKKAMIKNLSNSAYGVSESLFKDNLGEDLIISIAECLQKNKTIELKGNLAGKEEQVKICIQKIARFIIRFFSSKTLTADIKDAAKERKKVLNQAVLNTMDLKNVHLKKLPPLPSKPKSFDDELKKKVNSHGPLKSHELEELNKNNSLEKAEKLRKELQIEEHSRNLLGEIEGFNINKLRRVAPVVVKKSSNPLLDELLKKFQGTNVEDENEDPNSDSEDDN